MEILEQQRETEEDKVANIYLALQFCCCSVAKSYWTLQPMDCSRPGSLILCYLLEFAQIHVH